jgi:transcriptional regulator with XRE-family HTH domain
VSPDQDRVRVGRYIEDRRGFLGMSQKQLADAAGVDIKTIYNLESGRRWPVATTRGAIEVALEWSPGDLTRIAEGGEPTVEVEMSNGETAVVGERTAEDPGAMQSLEDESRAAEDARAGARGASAEILAKLRNDLIAITHRANQAQAKIDRYKRSLADSP